MTTAEFREILREELSRFNPNQLAPTNPSDQDQWLTLSELCAYWPTKPKHSTVYSWISKGKLPRRGTGRLVFLKSEIDALILQESGKKKKTSEEISEKNDQHLWKLSNSRRGRK